MAKAKKNDKSRAPREQPLALEALEQFGVFKGFSPPTDSFDPRGPWRHAYTAWVVGADTAGYLVVERSGTTLNVKQAIAQSAGATQHTEATLACTDDALGTPRAWHLQSWLVGLEGQPVPSSHVSVDAAMNAGRLELKVGGRTVTRRVPAQITSNWSLFDVVQRLPGAQTQPLAFALLEDLDLVKPDQELTFRERREIKLNGRTFQLDRYDHLGQGVLPWQYWVDGQHRLLVALSGQKAFVFDADAVKHFVELPKGRKSRIKVVD